MRDILFYKEFCLFSSLYVSVNVFTAPLSCQNRLPVQYFRYLLNIIFRVKFSKIISGMTITEKETYIPIFENFVY